MDSGITPGTPFFRRWDRSQTLIGASHFHMHRHIPSLQNQNLSFLFLEFSMVKIHYPSLPLALLILCMMWLNYLWFMVWQTLWVVQLTWQKFWSLLVNKKSIFIHFVWMWKVSASISKGRVQKKNKINYGKFHIGSWPPPGYGKKIYFFFWN